MLCVVIFCVVLFRRKIVLMFNILLHLKKKQEITEPDPKTFFTFWGTLQLFCAQPTGNSITSNQWYQWKADTLKVCRLLAWRVCDQAFGRYI